MKMAAVGLVISMAVPFFVGRPARGDSPFTSDKRSQYIYEALTTLKSASLTDLDNLYQFVSLLHSQKCQSVFDNVTVQCLQEETQRNCDSAVGDAKKRCVTLSDIVAVNKINESDFLTSDEVFDIYERSVHYHLAYLKGLQRKYALLTSEFLLSSGINCPPSDMQCLAGRIDLYCAHDADVQALPWQACVSAITWFIAAPRGS